MRPSEPAKLFILPTLAVANTAAAASLDALAGELLRAASCALEGDCPTLRAHFEQVVVLSRGGSGCVRGDPSALPAWRTNRIVAYIEDNISGRIDLRRLADSVGLSRNHVSRMFKRRFGLTLRLYIACRRIVKAQNLMLMTREPLCEIALRCGMCDQAHFARVFREMVGQTPSRWREEQAAAAGDRK